MENRVIIGLSGGVDSSAAAMILKDRGYDVTGVTLKLFGCDGIFLNEESACVKQKDIDDAEKVCKTLGIKHKILDFGADFRKNVADYFVSSYISGLTPNPCVICNRTVKFDRLFAEAKKNDAYIATGHYARTGFNEENGRYFIKKGLDEKKDQSYVLYGLGQETLSRLIFPLGEYSKDEIRALAEKAGLDVAAKKDSQDICFIPDGDYVSFIERYTGKKFEEGDFVLSDGTKIGRHRGIISYTVGQRKGLGISSEKPYYVIKKDAENNTVVLGREKELYTKTFTVKNTNFLPFEFPEKPFEASVRTRYKQKEKKAVIYPQKDGKVSVELSEPQKAVTPGQSAVFYDGDILLGGGIIE